MDLFSTEGYLSYSVPLALIAITLLLLDVVSVYYAETNDSWTTKYTRRNYNLSFGITDPKTFYIVALTTLVGYVLLLWGLDFKFVGWTLLSLAFVFIALTKTDSFPNLALGIMFIYCIFVEVVKTCYTLEIFRIPT